MRKHYLLWMGLVLLLLAAQFYAANHRSTNAKPYTFRLEQYLKSQEKEVNEWLKKEGFFKRMMLNQPTEQDWESMRKITNAPYYFYIYHRDSLVFWSNNATLPYLPSQNNGDAVATHQLIQLKGSFYEMLTRPLSFDDDERMYYTVIALIPIYKKYPVQNHYLKSGFVGVPNIPKPIIVSEKNTPFPVRCNEKKVLFYLEATDTFMDAANQWIILLLCAAGGILVAVGWNKMLVARARAGDSWRAFGLLVGSIVLVQGMALWMQFLRRFDVLQNFWFEDFSTAILAWSVQDFFINAALCLWVSLFFFQEVNFKKIHHLTSFRQLLFAGLGYGVVMGGIFVIGRIVRGLVLSAKVSFQFQDLYNLNTYNFTAVMAIVINLLAYFAVSHKIMEWVRQLSLPRRESFALVGTAAGVLALLYLLHWGSWVMWAMLLFSVFYVWLFDYFLQSHSTNFTWLVTWLFVFSGLTSGLLYTSNNEREVTNMMKYAKSLAYERDARFEQLISPLAAEIQKDPFIQQMGDVFMPRAKVERQLNSLFSEPYLFVKFDYEVHFYDAQAQPIQGEMLDYNLVRQTWNEAAQTAHRYLRFWSNKKGERYYLLKIPIAKKQRPIGEVVLFFAPKKLNIASQLYPELLIDQSFEEERQNKTAYDYAIYLNNQKVREEGHIHPNAVLFRQLPNEGQYTIRRAQNEKYILYRTNQTLVAVSSNLSNQPNPMSLFSYLFALLAIVLVSIATLNYYFAFVPNISFLNFKINTSLRSRIQTSVIAVIILTFLIIGFVTIFYFRADSEEYHRSRLERKASSVSEATRYEMRRNGWDSTYLPDIEGLSLVHKIDINIYGKDGRLLTSSQPDIFEKGLLSRVMPPLPYFMIRHYKLGDYDQDEAIGSLKYEVAYLPVQNTADELVAYMGLPYHTEQINLRNDVSEFIGTLLNVYIFLLLLAGVAAIVMANSITRPLTVLGNRLREVGIGTKNEPIHWESNDELGLLIAEYNKMIVALEKSAALLAKAEREGAWREMAKQVAHEIKNPLTPMKLSVQYLLRAYETRPEAIGFMLKKVANTLVEQIDSLTRIATEFSNFAAMPKAVNEHFLLNDLVASVFTLFQDGEEEERHTRVSLEMTNHPCHVFADKEQMQRVLNNIIKNAIQAIPDDREGVVKVLLDHKNDHALVAITDNGCGIPDDKRKSIFVPNFTTKNSGTGLGLAISKSIVENANGVIYFESQADVGTTFFVELPLVAPEEQTQE